MQKLKMCSFLLVKPFQSVIITMQWALQKQQVCDAYFDFTTNATQKSVQTSKNVVLYHLKGELI